MMMLAAHTPRHLDFAKVLGLPYRALQGMLHTVYLAAGDMGLFTVAATSMAGACNGAG